MQRNGIQIEILSECEKKYAKRTLKEEKWAKQKRGIKKKVIILIWMHVISPFLSYYRNLKVEKRLKQTEKKGDEQKTNNPINKLFSYKIFFPLNAKCVCMCEPWHLLLVVRCFRVNVSSILNIKCVFFSFVLYIFVHFKRFFTAFRFVYVFFFAFNGNCSFGALQMLKRKKRKMFWCRCFGIVQNVSVRNSFKWKKST